MPSTLSTRVILFSLLCSVLLGSMSTQLFVAPHSLPPPLQHEYSLHHFVNKLMIQTYQGSLLLLPGV